MNALHDLTKFGMILLMFIGAGSGSTGGGVKITTFAVLVMSIVSVLTGKKETVIFRRRVDHTVVNKALAVSLLGMLVVYLTSFVLLLDTPDAGGVRVLFEAVSAFSTAGLSCGVCLPLAIRPARVAALRAAHESAVHHASARL